MAEIWRQQPLSVYRQWVADILEEASDSLSDWESNFIDSIELQLSNKYNLTQAQAETLERIYAEKTK